MCYFITFGIDREIPNKIINDFKIKNISVERIFDNKPARVFSSKYKYVYTVTTGMCSCDFFKKTSSEKKFNVYISFLKTLFQILIDKGYLISFYFHMYSGMYGEEDLPILPVTKMKAHDFISNLQNLEEDVVYVTNKYI
ncbi:hypothetical protein [Virgibacillus pantothenticus]|uniref:hypothetical protein n=1 Tax=Virgibacillus pantothenticus TaxID=1473 RepID=UPI000984B01A|nr:hypothetical protein [Virgibacillus pantothenticus]